MENLASHYPLWVAGAVVLPILYRTFRHWSMRALCRKALDQGYEEFVLEEGFRTPTRLTVRKKPVITGRREEDEHDLAQQRRKRLKA